MPGSRAALAIGALVAGLFLSGCDRARVAATIPPVQGEKATTAKPDIALNTRLIESKARLQRDPNSADARFTLGTALLDFGDLRAAELELDKALELGLDPATVLPVLARTRNLLGKHRQLIDEHAKTHLSDRTAAAALKLALAEAHATLGEQARAKELVDSALTEDPDSAPPQVMKARIAASEGQLEEARRQVDRILAQHPGVSEAWRLKGDLLRVGGKDRAGAVEAYERGLQAEPRHLPIHATLIAMALEDSDLPAARERLTRQQRLFPMHAQSNYYAARIAEAGGDLEAARQIVQRLLVDHPSDLRFLLLAATVDLRADMPRMAEEHLSRALIIGPTVPRTRHLLARTYLSLGEATKAQMILEPLIKSKAPDATVLGLSGEAALQAGLPRQAARFFERAAATDPGNARLRAALGVSRISAGDLEAGFRELESAAGMDATTFSDMALLSARLAADDLPAAVKAAERVAAKQPGNPMPPMMLGRLKLRLQKPEQAREHFERALELDRSYAPAAVALAQLDLQAGAHAEARRRFDGVLARDPNNVDALLALAEIRLRSGDSDQQVVANLQRIVESQPSQPKAWLALVDFLILKGYGDVAAQFAQKATNALPEDLTLADALGRAQLAAGDSEGAGATFRRIISLRPRSPGPHLRLAEALVRRNEMGAALESVRQADALNPGDPDTQALWVSLAIGQRSWPEALKVARSAQFKRPKDPQGYSMEGMVLAAQSQWDAALGAFRQAEQRGPSTSLTMLQHSALLQMGKGRDAEQLAARWLSKNAGDVRFMAYLGDLALANRQFAKSETYYLAALQVERENVDVMNNLAWALVQQGKPGAVKIATRALELRPKRADVMDTLAMALAGEDRLPEALEVQKKAAALQPNRPMLSMNLARLAIKSKNYPLARAELDKLSALGKAFPAQAEVWQLRQQLP